MASADKGDPYRGLSLWLDTFEGDLTPQNPIRRDTSADVAIIGGGFTGLWTAWYLSELDPELRVVVLEKDICGFGASGRNGGWCVGELVAGVDTFAKWSSHDAAMRLARAVFDSVDEVGRVTRAQGIDCGYEKGGTVYLARNAPQEKRQRDLIDAERAHGFTEEEIGLLTADEARARVNATDVRSGIHFAATAAIDPARLVRGLADACQARGVEIHESSPVIAVEPGRVVTSRSTVRAPVIVRGLEGYTRNLPGHRRSMVPLYSLMVATEPLDDAVFEEIGLDGRPTFADDRYAVIYGQRTEDNRIAFGGRGVPYVFGSRITPKVERHEPTHALVERTLVELFPALADARITHRWGGVLGAPRNFTPSVNFDPSTGMANAGGYVGEGVAPSNLAGRTLADLIVGADTERATLPWVNHPSRKWEPEPLRFLGVWGTRRVMFAADQHEYATNEESKAGLLASKLL